MEARPKFIVYTSVLLGSFQGGLTEPLAPVTESGNGPRTVQIPLPPASNLSRPLSLAFETEKMGINSASRSRLAKGACGVGGVFCIGAGVNQDADNKWKSQQKYVGPGPGPRTL